MEHESSDLDVVVELSTAEQEDDLFNAFNEGGLHIGEVKVDINLLQHSEQVHWKPICHRWRNIWRVSDRQESRKRRRQK